MEFHVPQDRIRIFIPGFDSNPCGGESTWRKQLGFATYIIWMPMEDQGL